MTDIRLENAEVTIKTKLGKDNIVITGICGGALTVEQDHYEIHDFNRDYVYRLETDCVLRLYPDDKGNLFHVARSPSKSTGPIRRTAAIDIADITVPEITAARDAVGAPKDAQFSFDRRRQPELIEPVEGAKRPANITFYWSE